MFKLCIVLIVKHLDIGNGDILRRLLCKFLLKAAGKEATRTYKTNQLCGGLQAGMEGTTHHMRSLWDIHNDEDDNWDVLFVDALNAFNEGSLKMMVCVARN